MSVQTEDGRQRPQWRRKWRSRPATERRAASDSLRDLFAPVTRTNRVLWLLLGLSLIVHIATAPFFFRQRGGVSREQVSAKAKTYMDRVTEKERGRIVAKDVEHRITMPPPPPDPEGVVEKTVMDSVGGDIARITASLLTVEVRKDLVAYIEASLKSEIAAASTNIVKGKLSEADIEKLRRKFEGQAGDLAKQWRKDYLVSNQVQRAAVSTTEWYEQDVSRTLFGNLGAILGKVWEDFYVGGYGWGAAPNWSKLRSYLMFTDKLAGMDGLLSGKWRDAGGKGKDQHPAWPGPNLQQAECLQASLKGIREGNPAPQYPVASWKTAVYGGSQRPALTTGVLREFHAHRLDEMKSCAAEMDALWEKALAEADDYAQKAASGVEGADLAAAQTACFTTLKRLRELAGRLCVRDVGPYDQVNWALRTQVLMSPERDKAYEVWVDTMTKGLEPMIKDFAKGQFKSGIIVHKAGVDQALKEFPATVVPLLRKDVMALLPKARFEEMVFMTTHGFKEYRSAMTGRLAPPTPKDLENELANMKRMVDGWPAAEQPYAVKRRDLLVEDFHAATARVSEELLSRILTGNLLLRSIGAIVEGVDYADKVQEKLQARQAAMQGRGQDMAKLTESGLPDTAAPLVALLFGASKGEGAGLSPVPAAMQPGYMADAFGPEFAMRAGSNSPPPAARSWGTAGEQATVGTEPDADTKPAFDNILRVEGIPFLPKFPKLDGDLSDWGVIRPLRLSGGTKPFLLYAAWNYQGFFFGYHVDQPSEQFFYPSFWHMGFNHNTGGMSFQRVAGIDWSYRGDHLQLLFDTLDARNGNRGEPHTQEFVVLPGGTDGDPARPGVERVVSSQRDAKTKQYRGVKSSGSLFAPQPPPEDGPDGSGPYRITCRTDSGYTTEVFLPRSLFKVPVFAPGWYLGFDAVVAAGPQQFRQTYRWVEGRADQPDRWGDLLLLGTDPRIQIQEAGATWRVATHVIPGHSYLITVVDPDRNVNPQAEDTIVVSAEVVDGALHTRDAEVFILKETGKNTGVFRGFVDTQAGRGREVQGVLELKPLDTAHFGYVDFANSRGQRNGVVAMRLPAITMGSVLAVPKTSAGNGETNR